MTWLKTLNVHYTDVNSKGLESVVRLKNLRSLGLPRANITDQGVAVIATELPELQRLSLPKTQITDAAIKHIAKLTEMRNLTLTETRITNAAMAYVAKLTKLETLSMTRTAVRDEGLQHLDGLKNLTIVWASASQEERERFERVHPGVYLMPRPRAPRPKIRYSESKGLQNAHLRTQVTAEMVDELKRIDKLGTVFLSRESDDRDMTRLSDVPMTGIAGWAPAITDRGIKALENHPTLESFNLFESSITDLGLKSISRIPRLTKVKIDKAAVTDDGVRVLIEELSEIGQLKSLGFYKCPSLTDVGLQHIGRLTSLERLFLNNNDSLTSGLLKEISKLRKLTRLELDSITLDEADLVHLTVLTELLTLGLSCSKSNPNLTDRGLVYVSRLPSLQSLTIQDARITDKGVPSLIQLSKVQSLGLARTEITDQGVAALASGLPNLLRLGISGTKVTDSGMVHVGKMAQLEWLWLDGTAVGDNGLQQLDDLKNLEVLYISNATQQALERYERRHPKVRIMPR